MDGGETGRLIDRVAGGPCLAPRWADARALPWLFALACALVSLGGLAPGTARAAGNGATIELHQTEATLRQVYRDDKRVNLPRMALFDADGRLLMGETGLRRGFGRRLARALARDQPLDVPLTLDRVLEGALDGEGRPVAAGDLPAADGYVVDYWAEWCVPCREMARDIEREMRRWQKAGKQVVWIKIESDPLKLPENGD